jgi:hypothetical protein
MELFQCPECGACTPEDDMVDVDNSGEELGEGWLYCEQCSCTTSLEQWGHGDEEDFADVLSDGF